MNYVYILKCNDNTLYTGWTTDISHRLAVHNSGKGAKYTRSRLPVSLVYFEECEDKSTALRREFEIKSMTREKKIMLIESRKSGE